MGHYRRSTEENESEVPVLSIDYMWIGTTGSDGEADASDGNNPVLVVHDRRTKMKYARMVEARGEQWCSQRTLVQIIKHLGYDKLTLNSVGEKSIVALKEATVRELRNEKADVEIIMGESPVGSSGSNGEVERAIRETQGQIRSMKRALEFRIGEDLDGSSNIMPWMIIQA